MNGFFWWSQVVACNHKLTVHTLRIRPGTEVYLDSTFSSSYIFLNAMVENDFQVPARPIFLNFVLNIIKSQNLHQNHPPGKKKHPNISKSKTTHHLSAFNSSVFFGGLEVMLGCFLFPHQPRCLGDFVDS